MRHSLPRAPQFYVTAPQPCPYLAGQLERKLFTALGGDGAEGLNNALSHQGFRRSQNVLYRPSCPSCSACMSARVPTAGFRPSRSQRRVMRANAGLVRRIRPAGATQEQFELFEAYLHSRHADGGMAGMDVMEYAAMVEQTPINTRLVEYRDPAARGGKLRAVALTDVLADGVSMVYSFFDPEFSHRGLGTYMILDHVAIAREAGLDHVYLGYWVPGSAKMDYKARFRPLQVFRSGQWQVLQDPGAWQDPAHPLDSHPIVEQVAAIHLPPDPRRQQA